VVKIGLSQKSKKIGNFFLGQSWGEDSQTTPSTGALKERKKPQGFIRTYLAEFSFDLVTNFLNFEGHHDS
jgi:hypothetical protein